jgi:(1->4)-alpha-D-glucan 1-alpha-D-glucosylmutase
VVRCLVARTVIAANRAAGIDRLAELVGIEPSYRDYFGHETVVGEDTKRAFLRALGYPVDSPDAIHAAVVGVEEGPWRRALEPVTVALAGTPLRVSVTLPTTDGARELAWRIVQEDGPTQRGTVRFDALAPSATREVDGIPRERRVLELVVRLPLGYHRFELVDLAEMVLIVAPARCYLPPAIDRGAKVWGLAVQLYSLRSRENWGVGDFGDLRALASVAQKDGAAAVGLNPLHELDPTNPAAASPYSPSSRLHLSGAYLAVEEIADFAECAAAMRAVAAPAFVRRLADLRAAPLVEYAAVAACKRPILELLYTSFRTQHLERDTERARAFRAFVARGGASLERLTVFEALRERFATERPFDHGWAAWPPEFCDPEAAAVTRFASEQRARVEFFAYLQWNADLQLGAAAAACAGMAIGLYRDLAVGAEPSGAEAWANSRLLVAGVAVGAPADSLNVRGQNWGLAPLNPIALREHGYLPFAELIRANMRHAGALRIDHAMSLQRLFWIPAGRPAVEGTYIRYPLADLLAIVALESERNGCLVVGEDLGTVPAGFRERLQSARIFSYRLLYFEREPDGAFTRPDDYPPLALVSPGTHDLPTLPAYWLGRDLALRAQLGLLPAGMSLADGQAERAHERSALIDALIADGDLRPDVAERLRAAGSSPDRTDLSAAVEATYRHLGRARARLLMASIEDILGIVDQINVPGTITEHPNWRRKLNIAVEDLPRDGRFAGFAAALHELRALPAPPTVPTATYRLQFHRGFRFVDAERIVPYLHELGISHVYASPFLAARSGSTHGYDIIDHGALNPEVGTRAEFERFVAELHRRAMGLVLDFVPNHMGVGAQNPWWQDVLEWGRASPYAPYFDFDFHPPRRELQGKVLLPFLGAPYGEVIERGDLQLTFDSHAGTFSFVYAEHRFPLAPRSYADVLRVASESTAAAGGPAGTIARLGELRAGFERSWAPRSAADRTRVRELADEAKRRLADAADDVALGAAIAEALRRLNGDPADPSSFEDLHRLVRAQHYRPAFWRVAFDEINYRRFFDINELAGLRVEYAECFAVVHRFVLRLIEDGFVQGLRIDHVDGLFDPKAYVTLLRSSAVAMDHPPYVVVEKILARHESLRDDWPVAGTTGYEFANLVNGLFVDGQTEGRFDLMYRTFTGQAISFDIVLYACKRMIMDVNLAAELEVLANELDHIAQSDVRTSDFTRTVLRNALADVVAAFPVYRTYVSGEGASPEDRREIDRAVAQARKRSSALDKDVFDFIGSILTTDAIRGERPRYRERDVVHFAMKFQQYTAPVMAKALEDTSFYRYPRLVSLNEVGGDPRRFGVAPTAFHRSLRERAAKTPYALSTTATHDTKRGEDTRLRIDALTELPSTARRALVRLERINRRHKRDADGVEAPDRTDEWLLYQTLVGTWPLEQLDPAAAGPIAPASYVERIETYVRKAMREAKRRTSWANPNLAYEEATGAFVRAVLHEGRDSPFWSEFSGLAEAAARIAMVHGLAQIVLKMTAPGVPDTYQGTELWDFSLVDPDNRRPVDWGLRERLIAGLPPIGQESAEFAREVLNSWRDGRVKLFVTRTLLRLRLARREMFLNDHYVPLETAGEWADRVVAFQRRGTIVVVPRLVGGPSPGSGNPPLGPSWHDTQVAPNKLRVPRTYRNVFTGEMLTIAPGAALAAAQAFANFPVAVLVPEDEA